MVQVGLVRSEFQSALVKHPDVFRVMADKIEMNDKLKTFEERTAAMDAAVKNMRRDEEFEALSRDGFDIMSEVHCPNHWFGDCFSGKCYRGVYYLSLLNVVT